MINCFKKQRSRYVDLKYGLVSGVTAQFPIMQRDVWTRLVKIIEISNVR